MRGNDISHEDAAAFKGIILRAGFLEVQAWQESHGCETRRIFQRPVTGRCTGLYIAGEEIAISRRRQGYNDNWSWSIWIPNTIQHDYVLAQAILREAAGEPEIWTIGQPAISPCCTASTTAYERRQHHLIERFDVIAVAGHGVWAAQDSGGAL